MEDGILKIIDEFGEEKEYKILFLFDEEENKESYVVYTDYSMDEEGNLNIFSNLYIKEGDKIKLFPIKNGEVKKYIVDKLDEIRKV